MFYYGIGTYYTLFDLGQASCISNLVSLEGVPNNVEDIGRVSFNKLKGLDMHGNSKVNIVKGDY